MSDELTQEVTSSEALEAPQVSEATSEVSSEGLISLLPDDLKNEASLSDFKDVGGLAKSYVNAQRMLGSSVRIPTEDASDEDRQAFYSKLETIPGVYYINDDNKDQLYERLGRPKEYTEYKLAVDEAMIDGGAADQFKQLAHSIGLTSDQVSKLSEFEQARMTSQIESMHDMRSNAEVSLKETWGTDYNNRLASAKAAASVYQEKYPDAMSELINGPSGNNPALLAVLAEVGKSMHEKGVAGPSQTQNLVMGVSSEEAKEKIQEVERNSNHPYYNRTDPGHEAAVQKMRKLYLSAYPND